MGHVRIRDQSGRQLPHAPSGPRTADVDGTEVRWPHVLPMQEGSDKGATEAADPHRRNTINCLKCQDRVQEEGYCTYRGNVAEGAIIWECTFDNRKRMRIRSSGPQEVKAQALLL